MVNRLITIDFLYLNRGENDETPVKAGGFLFGQFQGKGLVNSVN